MLLLQANIIKLLINITLGCWQNVWNDSDIFHIGEIKKQKKQTKTPIWLSLKTKFRKFLQILLTQLYIFKKVQTKKKNTIKQNKTKQN